MSPDAAPLTSCHSTVSPPSPEVIYVPQYDPVAAYAGVSHKGLIELRGVTLVSRVIKVLNGAGIMRIGVSTNEQAVCDEVAGEAQTLAAYREMLAAAKGERPDLFTQGGLFLLASAWRDPADDKASCTATPGPCNGTAKAVTCSAHWSGRAVDINLGFIAGGDPTDSTYANRLHQARSAAYAWMLDNAGRFGFVNYYYEPWHWEWVGDPAR